MIFSNYPRDPDGNYTPPRVPAVIEPPEPKIGGLTESQLEEACRLIQDASRPVIYAGGGIVTADCGEELVQLAERLQCPVTTTLMGHGIFPPHHKLALHSLGMHGSKYANTAVNEADLVIAAGVRFDDRVTGNVNAFIRNGKIIHVDIDRDELNKNKTVTLPICADIKLALQQLCQQVEPGQYAPWLEYVTSLREKFPFDVPETNTLRPQLAIQRLCELTDGEAIVSLGVGQHQMWAMQHYKTRRTRSFLSSSGFGTMGYGLPAAMGAKVACPDRMVIDIDGDGSLNMTIHELACCHRYKIGVKIVVINNQWLGMVRQWQDMIYDKHRSGTDLSDPNSVKRDDETEIYPNFLKVAEGYGVKAERVTQKHELAEAINRMLADPDEPYLLDVIVEAEENVYPMIPAGGTYKDIIMSPEDLPESAGENQGSNI